MKTNKKYSKGFTLVELLLVIAIIAILATVLFVSLGGQRERARTTAFKENMRGLVTTFTACADGSGTIATGNMDGAQLACSPVGTSGVSGKVPKVTQCNDASTVLPITSNPRTGDGWTFTATCNRSGSTTCVASCNADGCVFTGTCE